MQLHEKLKIVEAEGAWLGNLGNAYAALGDVHKAIEFYEQALVIAREIGDRQGEGADLGNLGNLLLPIWVMRAKPLNSMNRHWLLTVKLATEVVKAMSWQPWESLLRWAIIQGN